MRADRLLSIMLLLHERGRMTTRSLAKKLEVSVRTILRDIDALSFAGVPIYTQRGPNGGVFLDKDYRVALTSLTHMEIQSLFIEGTSQPLSDLGLGNAAQTSYLKLLAALPDLQRLEANRLRERIYIDSKGWFHINEDLPHLTLLRQAVWEELEVEMTYENAEGVRRTRHIEPYGIVYKPNTWYLVGKVDKYMMRTFRISRIKHTILLDYHFDRDSQFNLKTYWDESSTAFEEQFGADYPAKLRVHPSQINYFEWYLTGRYQKVEPPDALGWQVLDVLFYSQREACMTVFGMGLDVEVIEPEGLLHTVIETARKILNHSR